MKAIVRDRYGPPDVLRLVDMPKPTPKDDEVLVAVRAAAVNRADWEILRGSPLWVRLAGFGLVRPKTRILGSNFAGQVEAVGREVTEFDVGDAVFGDILESGLGAFAEYVCVPQSAAVVKKPDTITFEAAASVPEAGFIALQAIRDRVGPGQTVLINGAGGGAGTFAIQLAKSIGAEVTAVDTAEKLDLMRSLGADHVVDCAREDVAARGTGYHLILDVVGIGPIATWKRALAPGGTYLAAGGTVWHLVKTLLLGAWVSRTAGKTIRVLGVRYTKDDLCAVIALLESGAVAATIDRTYALEDLPQALEYLGAGKSKGKVVIVP